MTNICKIRKYVGIVFIQTRIRGTTRCASARRRHEGGGFEAPPLLGYS